MKESMYKVVGRDVWEKLRKEHSDTFCEKPRWLSKGQAIYTGSYPPETVITYPEVLEIAAKVVETLPIGKVVVDSSLHFHNAEGEVLRIVQCCLCGRNDGEK